MSRVKEQLENIEWDLHEQPQQEEQNPIELSGEISPDIFGIEPIKAQEMVSGLSTVFAEREVLKNAYIDVIELPVNTENLPIFKELRLKIVKNRTQGLTKWKEKEKSFYLAGGNFIQAIYNKEVAINEQMEAKLLEAEKYFENQEKEKARLLNLERIARISEYVQDTIGLDFSEMSDYDFDDYVLGKKTRFENEAKAKIEAEEKAEAERLAEIERQKAIEAENAILKAQAEVKELELQKERAKQKSIQEEADKKAREEKAKQDAILKAEQEAKAKLESELQAKKDAEIKAENERIAKEKSEKEEAEKLAKAPIKKQMEAWVNSFELPTTEVDNEISKEIIAKYESFKKWSITQINKL